MALQYVPIKYIFVKIVKTILLLWVFFAFFIVCTTLFSAILLPILRNQDPMTSLVSLLALNYFNTSCMILTKLRAFYLVSLWHVLMFVARGLS